MRRIPAVLGLTLVGLGAAVMPATGCQSCAIDCGEQAPLARTVEATVVSVEDGVVRFELEDVKADGDGGEVDDEIDVLVTGRASALDVGSSYTVPLHEEAADEVSIDDLGVELPTANLPSGCDCGAPFITNADGSEVDTSILPDVPLRKIGWAFLSAASIAVVGWACLRLLVGEPL